MRRAVLGAVACCLLVLTGCTSLEGTGDRGFIPGDGRVRYVDPDDRGDVIELTGTSMTGDAVDSADYRGTVLVVNVWWSGCGPCRTEMPWLAELSDELGSKAAFLGLNIRDTSTSQGQSFMDAVGVDYPSIYDPRGRAVLAFAGHANLASIPTTIVLDDEGRVAAVISGDLPSKQTLADVVDDVIADAPGTSDG